jgi:hypothetical protein
MVDSGELLMVSGRQRGHDGVRLDGEMTMTWTMGLIASGSIEGFSQSCSWCRRASGGDGALDSLQRELEEGVGEVRTGMRSVPVLVRGGGGTRFRWNSAGTVAVLGTSDKESRHPGGATRREKGRGEARGSGAIYGGSGVEEGAGFGEGRRIGRPGGAPL